MTPNKSSLVNKFATKDFTACVVGLGYVGLPLVVTLAKAGIKVIALDISEKRIEALKRGDSYIQDVSSSEYRSVQHLITPTTDYRLARNAEVINIAVPTPLVKTKDPDISYIIAVGNGLKDNMRPGQLVILESTTYPGTTDELLLPILNESGLKLGHDFFLAFSPERVDPGNPTYHIKNTPKVVGGVTNSCTEVATAFYKAFLDKPVPVSSSRVAEMVKLLENTFRWVNIGLVNELSVWCNLLGIDTWETIDAAATKPFGFMKFYPGPGLGGHCIPVDPYYLSWKLKTFNYDAKFIDLAGKINFNMPHYVVQRVTDGLNDLGKSVKNSKILLLGVAYKENIDDMRESPALDIINELQKKGANVFFHDPYVAEIDIEGRKFSNQELTDELLNDSDCVIVTTKHNNVDYNKVAQKAKLVVDTRNALPGIKDKKIFRL